MCTVTFFPTNSGYVVAMNRDDLFSRSRTLPPSILSVGIRKALFPSEASGGTWIGVNDAALTFCLLNWGQPAGPKLRSRGEVIPRLLATSSLVEVEDCLTRELLAGVLPFRLLGFSLNENSVLEWRWDGHSISKAAPFPWELNHWFSSGLSDEQARSSRIRVCDEAAMQTDVRSREWLRRLHRSHAPEPGAFSICAHRPDAGTLSYTEIVVSRGLTEVSYSDASPCLEEPLVTAELTYSETRSPKL